MRAGLRVAIALLLLAGGRTASAQVDPTALPVYHGFLSVRRAGGTIDRSTGTGTLHVPRWTLLLATEVTNGIVPDQQDLVVAMADENFTLPAGSLKPSRKGKVFTFKAAPGTVQRGIRNLRLWLRSDGSYGIRFTVAGVELSRLKNENGYCVPFAIIIGDDDFFDGVFFASPSFFSRRVVLTGCQVDSSDWPWIR